MIHEIGARYRYFSPSLRFSSNIRHASAFLRPVLQLRASLLPKGTRGARQFIAPLSMRSARNRYFSPSRRSHQVFVTLFSGSGSLLLLLRIGLLPPDACDVAPRSLRARAALVNLSPLSAWDRRAVPILQSKSSVLIEYSPLSWAHFLSAVAAALLSMHAGPVGAFTARDSLRRRAFLIFKFLVKYGPAFSPQWLPRCQCTYFLVAASADCLYTTTPTRS